MTYENRVFSDMASRTMERRTQDRRASRKAERRVELLGSAEPEKEMGFWCGRCSEDFKATGFKTVFDSLVWYKAFHGCGKEVIRRWTERPDDEYYNLSEMIRVERQAYADDTLSPMQSRFKVLYEDEADVKRGEENMEVEQRIFERFGVEGARSSIPNELKEYHAKLYE